MMTGDKNKVYGEKLSGATFEELETSQSENVYNVVGPVSRMEDESCKLTVINQLPHHQDVVFLQINKKRL